MSTPKSTNERIRRKLRPRKIAPDTKEPERKMIMKKTGNNDPTRNRGQIAKEFVEYYKGNGEPKTEYLPLIEKLIGKNISSEGKFPMSLSRLSEMKEEIEVINEVITTPEEYADVAQNTADIPMDKFKMLVYTLVRLGMPKDKAAEFVINHKNEILGLEG
jgi:hypothetical protein